MASGRRPPNNDGETRSWIIPRCPSCCCGFRSSISDSGRRRLLLAARSMRRSIRCIRITPATSSRQGGRDAGTPASAANAWTLAGLLAFSATPRVPFHAAYIVIQRHRGAGDVLAGIAIHVAACIGPLLFLATPAFFVNGSSLNPISRCSPSGASAALSCALRTNGRRRRLPRRACRSDSRRWRLTRAWCWVPSAVLSVAQPPRWRAAWLRLLVPPVNAGRLGSSGSGLKPAQCLQPVLPVLPDLRLQSIPQ